MYKGTTNIHKSRSNYRQNKLAYIHIYREALAPGHPMDTDLSDCSVDALPQHALLLPSSAPHATKTPP